MEIENIPISEIKPYEKNPRKNEKAVEIVAKSIKEFGFKVPIILDKKNEIIAGHTRLKAAIKLNLKEVPIIRAGELTDEQVKAFRIMDNKSNEYAGWDLKLLKEEMKGLNKLKYSLELTGFTDGEIYNLEILKEKELNIIPKEAKYKIKNGEIWNLGKHKLICGDAKDAGDMERLMLGEKATIVFTDPPYNINYRPYGFRGKQDAYSAGKYKHKKVFSDKMTPEQYKEFLSKAISNCYIHTKEKAALFIWNGDKNLHIAIQACIDNKFKVNQIGAWVKNSLVFSPGCTFHKILEYCVITYKNGHKPEINQQYVKNQDNLFELEFKNFLAHMDAWYVNRDPTQEYKHPTQKPVELVFPAIYALTKEGDIMLDCFAGSGTTLIAAEENKRKAYVLELDPYYCSIIIQRWEDLTGKKAKKIN